MSASALPPFPRGYGRWFTLGGIAVALMAACVLVLLFRASIATVLVRRYLATQDMRSDIVVDSVGIGGATAHGTLSQPGADVSFERLVVHFDPQHWLPRVAAITLERPVVTLDLRQARKKSSSSSLGNIAVDVSQAKIIVLSNAGRVEIVGDARLVDGKPTRLNAVLLPARLKSGSFAATLQSGSLRYDTTRRLRFALAGDITAGPSLHLSGARVAFEIPTLDWDGGLVAAAQTAMLSISAKVQETQAPWLVEARFSNLHADFAQTHSSGDVITTATGALPPETTRALLRPLLANDRPLAQAYENAFRALRANAHLSWTVSASGMDVRLMEPAQITGGDAVALRVQPSAIHAEGSEVSGQTAMSLRSPGVPELNLSVSSFAWRGANDFDASFALNVRASIASLRDVTINAQATARRHGGIFETALQRCAALRLGAYSAKHPAMLTNTTAQLCENDGQALFSASATGWTLQGQVRDLTAMLPTASLKASRGSAELFIAGSTALPQTGLIHLSAIVSDAAKTPRAGPETVSGIVEIADAVAHGRFNLAAGPKQTQIGTVRATYRIATGIGHADLDFPTVAFARQGLQPAHISPLLAYLAQAEGAARFTGNVDWSAKGIKSNGRLDVDDLRFSSPLGVAQKLSTHMAFTSLLPLRTAPDQRIAIERIDWVMPLAQSVGLISLTPGGLRIANTKTEVADGEVSVTPFTVQFKPGATLNGTVRLSHVALGKLIAASNMGEKLKLEGAISGSLPFSFGPEGFRFKNGHLEADGPGRLSFSRSLWGKGEANAVQTAAYQALENLYYQSLTADIESVPGGRLHAIFRVVGYKDSPGTQNTSFSLGDLLTGKAFQKEIPIPRGTAVNLTLDTSLNFDELLRGYESTWSQVTAQAGAPP